MGRTTCTKLQCLYKGALYFYLLVFNVKFIWSWFYESSLPKCLDNLAVQSSRVKKSNRCSRRVNSKEYFNLLNPELNPICYFLALLGSHHFPHVSRIRVKLLTFRLLMSHIYIYMEHPFLIFLDHTQRRSTVGRTPLDE